MESPLFERYKASVYPVPRLRGERLREAIVEPAREVGVAIDSILVDRLVRDAGDEPGVLPHVQATLDYLWEDLLWNYLPLDPYERMSDDGKPGLQTAMARRAEAALLGLDDQQKAIARAILLRLVQFGEGRPDTRQRLKASDLKGLVGWSSGHDRVLERLLAHRLLVVGEEGDSGDSVQLAHEALIGGWPTLQRWIAAYHAGEQSRRWFVAQAKQWRARSQGGAATGLLDEGELREVERWRDQYASDLLIDPDLVDLIKASRAAIEREAREREEARQHELDQARALAEEQRLRAEAAERLQSSALAGSLAGQSVLLALGRRTQSDLPALLALQAYRFHGESQGTLRDAIDRAMRAALGLPHFGEVIPCHPVVVSLAFSPDARWLACGCGNGTFRVLDLEATGPVWELLRGETAAPRWERTVHTASLGWLVAHPNRPVVACVALDGAMFLVHLERSDVAPLRLEGKAWVNARESLYHRGIYSFEYPPAHLAFRHDGSSLVVSDGLAYDLTDLEGCFERDQSPPRCEVPPLPGPYFAFSPDDHFLIGCVPNRTPSPSYLPEAPGMPVSRLRVEEPPEVISLKRWYGGEIRREATSFCPCTISPDGRWVTQIIRRFSGPSELRVWDVSGDAGDRDPVALGRSGVSIRPRTMVFDSDSLALAAEGEGGWTCVWDLRRPRTPPITLGGLGMGAALALSPGGRVLASAENPQSSRAATAAAMIRVWRCAPSDASCAVLRGHGGAIRGLAFSPDGSALASCGLDGSLRIWDLKDSASDPLVVDLTRLGARLAAPFEEGRRDDTGVPTEPRRRPPTPIAFGPGGSQVALAVVARDGDAERECAFIFERSRPEAEPVVVRPPLINLGASGVHGPRVMALRFASVAGRLVTCDALPNMASPAVVRTWSLADRSTEADSHSFAGGVQTPVVLDDDGSVFSRYDPSEFDRYNPNRPPAGVRVWTTAEPDETQQVLVYPGGLELTALAIGPGGRWCAAADSSGVVWVWDRSQAEAEPVARQAHFGQVPAVATCPFCRFLAAGGEDGTIALWAFDQPEANPTILAGHQSCVNCLEFSADGRFLASGSDDGTIRIWIADLAAMAELVEQRLQRNLSPSEWRRYVGTGVTYRRTSPDLPDGDEPPSSTPSLANQIRGFDPAAAPARGGWS
jgi:WD40 repeat protein